MEIATRSQIHRMALKGAGAFCRRPIWPENGFFNSSRASLNQIPEDVMVDQLFTFLTVEDILILRRVSKSYYYLTHHPIIWKRFLRLMNIPLPPLPPTERHRLGYLTSLDAERMVIRAITLDDNWRQNKPTPHRIEKVFTHAEVLAMTVLPGGKYLVASVVDPGHQRYGISVFVLDRPAGPPMPLAHLATPTKAYDLQAKYTSIDGVQGITIAYIYRYFKKTAKTAGLDASEFSVLNEIDAPVPFQYECVCSHIALSDLEKMGELRDPQEAAEFRAYLSTQPKPFRTLTTVRSKHPLQNASLDIVNGKPQLAVVRHPETIVFRDLHDGYGHRMLLHCKRWGDYANVDNVITNIRVLPAQRQIIVVRTIRPNAPGQLPLHPIEIFNLPMTHGEHHWSPLDRLLVDPVEGAEEITTFHISDPTYPVNCGLAAGADRVSETDELPPISIFYRTKNPSSLAHLLMWPVPLVMPPSPPSSPGGQPKPDKKNWHYSLMNVVHQMHYDFEGDLIPHVLPGPYRSVVYTTPGDDRRINPSFSEMYSYITPCIRAEDDVGDIIDEMDQKGSHVVTRGRKPVRSEPIAFTKLPPQVGSIMHSDGFMSVAWDESVGRVCIAAADDFHLYVIDFAKGPTVAPDGQRHPLPLPDFAQDW